MKTYQLVNDGPYGSSIKVAPLTTETVHNLNTCFKVDGDDEDPVEAQSILPDISNFKVMSYAAIKNLAFNFYISCIVDRDRNYEWSAL